MSSKDTIDKAYGNIPKELPGTIDFNWIRGFKYYYLKVIRYLSGR